MMYKPLDPIQEDRFMCEVENCNRPGTDWDHNIFPRNKRFKKYVDNPYNMLRACGICNRITHKSDRWEAKKWLIDYHMNGENRDEFLEWFRSKPKKFAPNDLFRITNYIYGELTIEERIE